MGGCQYRHVDISVHHRPVIRHLVKAIWVFFDNALKRSQHKRAPLHYGSLAGVCF